MARNAGYSIENNFSSGLITEATGLNFPENAVIDTDNCVFDQKSDVSRRNGIDLESNSVNTPVTTSTDVYVEYPWESVSGDGNLTFHVQQIGSNLNIYRVTGGPSLSSNFIDTISLLPMSLVSADKVAENFAQFSSGLGRLVVVHPFCEPFFISYDKVLGTFSTKAITIQTRDFKGLEPHFVGRYSWIEQPHRYNLVNQGWPLGYIDYFYSQSATYPSDYDVWWLFKAPDAYGVEVFLPYLAVQSGIISQVSRGNSPAPKGSMILDEFYQDRGRVSGVSGIPVVTPGNTRPTATEFFAGRIFFAGVNAQDFGQKIYFSQILESESQFGYCYQANDPTSQYSPDLLPTDGGVLSIPDAGTIYKLVAVDNNLLVCASQGVWQITGSQGIGFTATDYTVKKISSAVTLSPLSFVKVDGKPLWWSLDDIYTAVSDNVGAMSVQSITNEKIKSFFQEIPEEGKYYAKGAYNNRDRVVQWLYRDKVSSNDTSKQNYVRILNLNVTTQAFYPWSIENPLVSIKGINVIKGQGSALEREDVVDNLDELIVDGFGNTVYINNSVTFTLSSAFKYSIVRDGSQFTFAELDEDTHSDWGSVLGGPVVPKAYFTTGYRIRGNAIKKTQANYLRIFVDAEKPQEFHISGQWDYSNSGNSGRWTAKQRLEFNSNVYDYLSRRIKIRGNGLVLQFKVESIGNSPFSIVGWSSFETGNERP